MAENPYLADANISGIRPGRRPWGCIALAGVMSAFCAGVPLFGVGYFVGLLSNDVDRGNRDVARVNRIIAANPDRLGSLRINRGPADKFLVEGTVQRQEDLDYLRDELVRAFGEARADYVLAVEVEDSADGG